MRTRVTLALPRSQSKGWKAWPLGLAVCISLLAWIGVRMAGAREGPPLADGVRTAASQPAAATGSIPGRHQQAGAVLWRAGTVQIPVHNNSYASTTVPLANMPPHATVQLTARMHNGQVDDPGPQGVGPFFLPFWRPNPGKGFDVGVSDIACNRHTVVIKVDWAVIVPTEYGGEQPGGGDPAQAKPQDDSEKLHRTCERLVEENRKLAECVRQLADLYHPSLAHQPDTPEPQKRRADLEKPRPRLQLGRARVPLKDGEIPRQTVFPIAFKEPFPEVPEVLLAVSGFDITGALAEANSTAVRIHATAENITKSGFALRVKTWHQSALSGFDVTWIAADPSLVSRETIVPHPPFRYNSPEQ